jgi:hypothetical protein
MPAGYALRLAALELYQQVSMAAKQELQAKVLKSWNAVA